MSLDVYLTGPAPAERVSGIFIRENGEMREITRAEWDERHPGREPVIADTEPINAYSANITHNLGPMARAAGIYEHLWRPEEVSITKAAELVAPLTAGLVHLCADPDRFRALNPENGWGSYDGLVRFVARYIDACQQHPTADVSVWR